MLSDTVTMKVEHFEDNSDYSYLEDTPSNMEYTMYVENSMSETVHSQLPDANDIRHMPLLLPIVKISDENKPLENKHRTVIAKALIDECLRYQPDRV